MDGRGRADGRIGEATKFAGRHCDGLGCQTAPSPMIAPLNYDTCAHAAAAQAAYLITYA